ncbi:RNA-guided endonuclease InsQ/TnpB family protein [Nocardia sp. CDC160]|uniref:RNA-guided endonuclease InsQ/TnpB family protein n=1 Tax=Nocardia sp. CDC160 TaxID=3112166 RepID=UPI002DB920A7|nr:transposase [Nocardia sp. CDC160]MEC3915076.1 transposase [Nocardia sp. CDC160]
MRRAYKFLLRPTRRQAQALAAMLADHCSLYNGALQERREAYRHSSKTTVRYNEQSAQLKEIRAFDPDRQGRWSFSSQQATLRRLDRAMQDFFRRIKIGAAPGYPRFKGVGSFDTVEFPRDGDGCRWDSTPSEPTTRVRFQGVGHVRVHRHRPVSGRVKTVSVKREGQRWYAILSCDDVPVDRLPETGKSVGIDMGAVHFLTTSAGTHVANPRYLAQSADRIAEAQRNLALFPRRPKAKRSRRHRAAAAKVAALHRKVGRQRRDHAHKTALDLVRKYDVIAFERLNIAAMSRAPKSRPGADGAYEPNGARVKAALNRSILDAGWRNFLTILVGKAESAGRRTIEVDARNTSRACPACEYVSAGNRATQAEFICLRCGFAGHADHVAARNIADRAGLVLPAAR